MAQEFEAGPQTTESSTRETKAQESGTKSPTQESEAGPMPPTTRVVGTKDNCS